MSLPRIPPVENNSNNTTTTTINHKAERVLSTDEVEFAQARPDYAKIDKEVAQYVSDVRIEISPEKNAELRRKIDKRVLVVMVGTYFLQAIDKGTLSFASIMYVLPVLGALESGTNSLWEWLASADLVQGRFANTNNTYL